MSINTVEYANQLLAENADLEKQVQELKSRLQLVSELSDAAAALHVEAEKQVQALAAENIALKKFCKNAAFDADYEAELAMEDGGFTNGINNIKTPATDAVIREIGAKALGCKAIKLPTEITHVTNKDFEAGRDAVIEVLEAQGFQVE